MAKQALHCKHPTDRIADLLGSTIFTPRRASAAPCRTSGLSRDCPTQFGCAGLTLPRREAGDHQHPFFPSFGAAGEVVSHRKVAVHAGPLSLHSSLSDRLVIKMRQRFDQPDALQQLSAYTQTSRRNWRRSA
jgi:hypothetical protein